MLLLLPVLLLLHVVHCLPLCVHCIPLYYSVPCACTVVLLLLWCWHGADDMMSGNLLSGFLDPEILRS